MSRTTQTASAKPKRIPVAGKNVLTVVGKDPNFIYRFVNDEGDRVQKFLDAGYEIVESDSVSVGDKRVGNASAEGTKAQVSVGKGQKAFLMRISKEWYEEDQKAKQAYLDKLEQSLKQAGDYGTITRTFASGSAPE